MLTAAIVVIVIATSLILTYNALTRARIESTHDQLRRQARQLVITSEQSIKARTILYRQVANDSAVRAVLRAATRGAVPRGGDPVSIIASVALLRLRTTPDSSLPIELWTTDGRRVLRVGNEIRDDSVGRLRPEMRALNGKPVTEIPTGRAGPDSLQYGAFYVSSGRVLFWTIVPIVDGRERVGYLAQQRAFGSTAQNRAMVRELLGNDAALNLHNATDQFWTNYSGEPIPPVTGVDTATGNFIGRRTGVGKVIVSEAAVPGTPWIFSLEAPVASVIAEPQATLRRLAVINFLIALAGVLAAWLLSRRVTAPLVRLISASDAIARGDYDTRMPLRGDGATQNEVSRLAATFNRMAEEIETSHQELERQRDAAMQANRAKGDFLAVMSHELRTPLNAIGGYADILQLGIYGEVTAKQKEALARIMRSQQMLLSLINDVLNFAKLDAGQVQYRMANVPLDALLAQVEQLVAPQLEAKSLRYQFERCDAALVVRADREKLTQIVLNLLSNAIKFTAPEGTIRLACDVDATWVRVNVHDTGIGIPADRLESIFDPFVQVDRSLNRPHEGVGLGLSISRDLAQGMGGTLTVRSTVGEGSTFTLRLRRGASD
ncbi:MAG: HAMP domain-containing histidine kinase [Gemmatimonadaceae bacterium]|nr:HAMP domain-containing histidine kinase [Gemmatimonadaceae bacterium]